MSKKIQVFLSYANEDLFTVSKVYEGLSKRGINLWFDKENLKPGKWKSQIMKAIAQSRFFLICISNAALRKTGDTPGFQDTELNRAFEIAMAQSDETFTIVPIRLENVDRGDHRLSLYQQYDLFKDWESELDRLAVHFGGQPLYGIDKEKITEEERMVDELFMKSETLYYAGDYSKALSFLTAVQALKEDTGELLYNKGLLYFHLSDYENVLDCYEKALLITPTVEAIWLNKGNVLQMLGKYELALSAYEQAIDLNPGFIEAWNNKGNLLASLGKLSEASFTFTHILAFYPDNAVLWFNFGNLMLSAKIYERALEAYNKTIELDSSILGAYQNRAIVINLLANERE